MKKISFASKRFRLSAVLFCLIILIPAIILAKTYDNRDALLANLLPFIAYFAGISLLALIIAFIVVDMQSGKGKLGSINNWIQRLQLGQLGSKLRARFPANGRLAKALSIIFLVWLFVMLNIVANIFNKKQHPQGPSLWALLILLAIIAISSIIPFFISTLQERIFEVFLYGSKKRRQAFLDKLKMDERQRLTRQRIFEKSYSILASVFFLGIYWSGFLFSNTDIQSSAFVLGYIVLTFVLGLPSLVAVWDKSANPAIEK